MIEAADTNNTGRVDQEQFVEFMKKGIKALEMVD